MTKSNLILCALFAIFTLKSCTQQNESVQNLSSKQLIDSLAFVGTLVKISLEKPVYHPPENKVSKAPVGMVYIPGGITRIGADDGFEHEQPLFWVELKPFFMDKNLVTVAQFAAFVKATGYITQAEKFGNAGIITDKTDKKWILQEGATWQYPLGKNEAKAPDNHPVTQVSWYDAQAYCSWAGKRLPNELEWEHAARNAVNSRNQYTWGNEIQENGRYKANIWQGRFPDQNTNEDGYLYTSPVGSFGASPLGLNDMSGNVWQWMANWKFNYMALFNNLPINEVHNGEKAERGGSFLCEPSWCHGYRVSGRSSSTPETSLFHVGFRCVKDLER